MLAFPERQSKSKLEEHNSPKSHKEKPTPTPAELKKFKELVEKNVEKDADGKPIIKSGDKELLDTAESFYGSYGYYPGFYPAYYPAFYPAYYPRFYPSYYPYHPYPFYGHHPYWY